MKRTITLKRGTNLYPSKIGTLQSILRVVPIGTSMVGVVVLVNPKNIPTAACYFYVLGEGDSLPPEANGAVPTYLGAGNNLDVFFPCASKPQ